MLVFAFSIVIDFLWFFVIYLNVLKSDEYENLARWEGGIHTTVLVVGIINLIVKIISIALSIFFEPEVKSQTLGNNPSTLGSQLR